MGEPVGTNYPGYQTQMLMTQHVLKASESEVPMLNTQIRK